jgi:Ras-related protein Rab-1A
MTQRSYDYLFKIMLVGSGSGSGSGSGVGITSILSRYVDNKFNDNYIPSTGIDFKFKMIKIDDLLAKVQIWDWSGSGSGMGEFRGIETSFARNPNGMIIVYDVTCRESFDNVRHSIREIRRYMDLNTPIMIVGNKSDNSDRQVSEDELKVLAADCNVMCIECSAKMNINIDKIFEEITREIIKLKKTCEKDLIESNKIKLDNNKSYINKCWS